MIAVDIGGSHITSVHISDLENGQIKTKMFRDLVQIRNRKDKVILDDWAKNINRAIAGNEVFDGHIAIAFPGPFNYKNGIVEAHQNGKFKSLEHINIREALLERIKRCKHIHFENDATSFGLGEYYYGNVKRSGKMIALTIGSGIGCTFIDNGAVIRNSEYVPKGGEVYHLPFNKLTADDYFSTRWFVNRAEVYGLKVKDVRQLIEMGGDDIKSIIFKEFSNNLIQFLSSIALKFETEVIVIGGNISKSWSYFGSDLVSAFGNLGISVEQSKLGEKAICLGAAYSLYNDQN